MIIMIGGERRSGKTTAADALVNEMGFFEINLAEPLYGIAEYALLNLDRDHGKLLRRQRQLLIDLGKALRKYDPDVLMNHAYWKMVRLSPTARYATDPMHGVMSVNFVIPNFRFQNEYEYLDRLNNSLDIHQKDRPGKIITVKMVRNGVNPEPGFDDDETENSLDRFQFDYVIEANPGEIPLIESMITGIARGDI